MQPMHTSNVRGIDVSHHQGVIDWKKVADSGITFVLIKATEGVGYTDPMLRRNAIGADAFGLKVGYYHYCRPETGNSVLSEADAFLKAVEGLPVHLPFVIDVEGAASGAKNLHQWVIDWLSIVGKHRSVMIYTGAHFARTHLNSSMFQDIPLWIAHYDTTTPMGNNVWSTWSIFQYSESGKVPGISGNVDLNVMERSFLNRIEALAEEDASKLIKFLSAGYFATSYQEAQKEFNRLANAVRRTARMKEM